DLPASDLSDLFPIGGEFEQILPLKNRLSSQDFSRRHLNELKDTEHRDGLSAPRFPHDTDNLSLIQNKGHVVHRANQVIPGLEHSLQMIDFQQMFPHSLTSSQMPPHTGV